MYPNLTNSCECNRIVVALEEKGDKLNSTVAGINLRIFR